MNRFIPLLFMACLLWSCFSSRRIQDTGLRHVRIGEEMPDVDQLTFHGKPLYDTLYDEAGFQWRAVILEYPQGKVYVEQDFFGEPVVNRIRIETPDLRYQKKIQVGSPASELQELNQRWSLVMLPDYQKVDLYAGRIHFLFPDAGVDTTQLRGNTSPLEAIPPDSKVTAIVIM